MSGNDLEIASLKLEGLPSGWEAVGAVVLLKCRDEDGDDTWAFRTSESVSAEEALGALVVRTDLQRSWLQSQYADTDGESGESIK